MVIVGAGPTGLTAALLLARRGVDVVVLERHAGVYPLPRAVHLDDEVRRLLQSAGVEGAFAGITRPAGGLRLLDRRLRTLAEFPRSPTAGPYGFPQANMFDQPALEQVLRDALHRAGVPLRAPVEVLAVEPGGCSTDPAVVLRDLRSGARERLVAAAVLGCDGAAGLTRSAVGARWQDLRFEQEWFVVDARCPVQLATWDGVHQVCDGRRASTFLQVGADRYRWEFALTASGPTPQQLASPDRVAELVRPWLAAAPGAELELLRATGYTFRARLADRWSRGRVFLLGDAAHLTPPFTGQGLGAGQRDAANLAWKLAAVLQGRAPEGLLETYAQERRPHARAMVRLAVLAGRAMTGGRGRAALARRLLLHAVLRLPGVPGVVLRRSSPPLRTGPLVVRRPGRRSLVGRLCPQPRVRVGEQEALLDDLLGDGFAVLTVARVDEALRLLAARLSAPLVEVGGLGDGGVLAGWLRRGGARTVVLRPDRAVLLAGWSRQEPGAELERRGADVLRLVGA